MTWLVLYMGGDNDADADAGTVTMTARSQSNPSAPNLLHAKTCGCEILTIYTFCASLVLTLKSV